MTASKKMNQGFEELSNFEKGPVRKKCEMPNQHLVGIGACLNLDILSLISGTIGAECLESPGSNLTDFFSKSGLKLNCYCLAGIGVESTSPKFSAMKKAKITTEAGATVNGVVTFGECKKAEDYSGGFFNNGFALDIPIPSQPGQFFSMSVNVGIGIGIEKWMNLVNQIKSTPFVNDPGLDFSKQREAHRLNLNMQFSALMESLLANSPELLMLNPMVFMQLSLIMGEKNKTALVDTFKMMIGKDPLEFKKRIGQSLKTNSAKDIIQKPILNLANVLKSNNSKYSIDAQKRYQQKCAKEYNNQQDKIKKFCQASLSELSSLLTGLAQNEKGQLGEGVIGKCHGINVGVTLKQSHPTFIPYNFRLQSSYTSYSHISDVNLSIFDLLKNLNIFSLTKKLGLLPQKACVMFSEKDKEDIRKSFQLSLLMKTYNACGEAIDHAGNDIIDIADSLLKSDLIDRSKIQDPFAIPKVAKVAQDLTRVEIKPPTSSRENMNLEKILQLKAATVEFKKKKNQTK